MGKIIINLLILLAISNFNSYGQNKSTDKSDQAEDSQNKKFSLFDSDKILEFSLLFDLKSYLRKDFKDPLEGIMTFHPGGTDSVTRKVKVTNRGTFRSSNCYFPPMEIILKKGIRPSSDLEKIYKLKLISRCETGAMYDEYVLREYLVYRLFSVLTDTSYRVRLMKADFIDSGKSGKTISQYGFIIEPKETIAARVNLSVVKSPKLGQKHIIPRIMDRLAIFNYMIGNYDWSVTGQHNVTILQSLKLNPSGLGIAIPHDFDGTGVVNPVYAIPDPSTGLKSIRQRKFLGMCRNREVYESELKMFLKKKPEFFRVINEFPYIDQKSKQDITDYLDEFFDQIEKQSSLDNLIATFLKSCAKN
jgi:hypothetical protein